MSSIASGAGGGGGTGGGRILLTSNTTYYVATTGSDSNNGLSALTPWLTLQHAADYLATTIDFNGFDVGVSIADGSYNGFFLGAMVASIGSITAQSFNIVCNALLTFYSASADYTKVSIGVDQVTVGTCISNNSFSPVIICIKNLTVDCRSLPQGAAVNVAAGAYFAVGDGNGGTVRLLGAAFK